MMSINLFIVQIKELLSHKVSKYAIIGGISTLIHAGVASLYIFALSDTVFEANIIGFLVAYVFSYIMQSTYVFKHMISITKAVKYFIVQFSSLLISILISNVFQDLNSYIKTFIIIGFMPLITFIIHKFWTFNEENS